MLPHGLDAEVDALVDSLRRSTEMRTSKQVAWLERLVATYREAGPDDPAMVRWRETGLPPPQPHSP